MTFDRETYNANRRRRAVELRGFCQHCRTRIIEPEKMSAKKAVDNWPGVGYRNFPEYRDLEGKLDPNNNFFLVCSDLGWFAATWNCWSRECYPDKCRAQVLYKRSQCVQKYITRFEAFLCNTKNSNFWYPLLKIKKAEAKEANAGVEKQGDIYLYGKKIKLGEQE